VQCIDDSSTVYVEADLEMRRSEQADGPAVDRVFLRQREWRALSICQFPPSEAAGRVAQASSGAEERHGWPKTSSLQ